MHKGNQHPYGKPPQEVPDIQVIEDGRQAVAGRGIQKFRKDAQRNPQQQDGNRVYGLPAGRDCLSAVADPAQKSLYFHGAKHLLKLRVRPAPFTVKLGR